MSAAEPAGPPAAPVRRGSHPDDARDPLADAVGDARAWRAARTARLDGETDRVRGWHEVLVIALGYAVYTLIRNAVTAHEPEAQRNGRRVVALERHLGLFHEHGINTWLAAHRLLAVAANYGYATLHFVVTIAVGGWLLLRHSRRARSLRIAWYSMNLLALLGFAFFPLAPPRLLTGGGFFDTVVRYGTWGSWGKHGIDSASNQFAAMPSMHVGWSAWAGLVLVVYARRWWVRTLGALYPVLTLAIILGTANHYLLDAAGGLGALAGGFLIARLVTGRRALERPGGPVATARPRRRTPAGPDPRSGHEALSPSPVGSTGQR